MIAKNVSTSPLDLSELDSRFARLQPGDTIELSAYTEAQKQQCRTLQQAFEVSSLIIVGMGKSSLARRKRLEATRGRLQAVGLDTASIPVLATPIQNRAIKTLDKRRRHTEVKPPIISEEQEEPHIEAVPEEQGIIALSARGVEILQPSDLPQGPVVEKKTLPPEEVRLLAKKFEQEHCKGINNNGRPCKRRAVGRYGYCLTHMPDEMRAEYKKERLQRLRSVG